uniref:Uncharacterized protein n=1 Tax=Calidris pygmaea TaxID=425635 RepID=A0A8C3KA19_9CHAR
CTGALLVASSCLETPAEKKTPPKPTPPSRSPPTAAARCHGLGPTSFPPPRTKENGLDRDPLHPEHLSKRPCTMSPAQRYSPSNGLSHPPNGLGHPPAAPPLPQHYRLEDMAMAHHYRDAYRHPDPRELRERQRPAAVHGARQEEVIDHRLTDREWAEEWKHLNNVRKERKSSATSFLAEEAAKDNVDYFVFLASLYKAQRTGVQYGKSPGSEEGSPARGRSAVR